MTATSSPLGDGVAGVFHTLETMRALVNEWRKNLEIRNTAISIIYLQPEKDEFAHVNALFEYVRDHIKYIKDINNVETISAPLKTLQSGIGDCDDQCILLATLAESVGIPSKFILAGYNDNQFEHVYCSLFANGVWVDCDPTENYHLGWAPPDPTVYHEEF